MYFRIFILSFFAFLIEYTLALERKAPPVIPVTNRVLSLTSRPSQNIHHLPPSSKYLARRNALVNPKLPRQDDSLADMQQDVLTVGGRVYMTNVTLATEPYTLVIDTGSSDTWVAASTFECEDRYMHTTIDLSECGFGTLYDKDDSSTYVTIPTHAFSAKYTDGEFLYGELGTEDLAVGGMDNVDGEGAELTVRQTIGVVERGYWMGDRISSGLMGLAYPTLASNAQALNYSSVVFSLFEDDKTIPKVFSLALSRPTTSSPRAGGLLAIGGIPDIDHDGDFVSVPIHPIISDVYAFYSVPVDGFDITPPSNTRTKTKTRHRTRNIHEESRQAPPQLANFSTPLNMIVDSGSTLLYFPDDVSEYIASLFDPPATYNSSFNIYTVLCDAAAPRVGVIVAGKTFFIHPDDLMNKMGDESNGVGGAKFSADAGICVVGIQKQLQGDAVLGDTWLKNVLAVFDVGENEMRFAGRENY